MKYLIPILALCLMSGCGDKKSASKSDANKSTATSKKEKVVDDGLPNSVAELITDFDTKTAESKKLIAETKDKSKQYKLFQQAPKPYEYAQKVMNLLEEDPEHGDMLDGLIFAARNGIRDGVNAAAIEKLVANYPDEPRLAEICVGAARIKDPAASEKALRSIIDAASDKKVKGTAAFALASRLQREQPGRIAEVVELYQGIVDNNDSLTVDGFDVLAAARTAIKRNKEAAEMAAKFAIGKVAPEITANDLDGIEFNLSDYRGKVVLLDFWGDW